MHASTPRPGAGEAVLPRKLLLRVRVDLGPNGAQTIEVREGDDPVTLAQEFCDREGVPALLAPKLGAEIHAQLKVILARKEQDAHEKESASEPRSTPPACSGSSDNSSNSGARSRKSVSREEAEATGRRLYNQGLKVKARIARELEEAKQEKHRQELEDCTFRPTISAYARRLSGGRTRGEGLELQVRKFQEAKIAREQMRRVRDKQEVEEVCSFKPMINPRSEELAAETRRRAESELRSANLHEDLFHEAAHRQAERLRLERTPLYSFKPEVHASASGTSVSDASDVAFLERLAAPKPDPECAADLAHQVDPTTGRELFKPQIGRAPKEPWARPADVSISDYLFYSRHQFRDIRDRLRQDEDAAAREIQERGVMSKTSRRIAQQIREDRFAMLWRSLRDDTLLAPSSQGAPVPTAEEIEERRLRVLVELLPEMLLRHIGPDAVLAASYLDEPDFVVFLMRASKGIPCTSDLLLS
ncbi:Hypothetical Protein FCC1311_103952 [Hondaea fermentalgiana]|uniref:Uncharacterized protein n=1 Tax=Hondaea fermentalgiana TaxID=2315210 RepID=A0A2R5H0A0_9STRA|nr:Hypothetical Protein FCC1311_103952 [Hondaea fermentalgiana]|eukprot:GBG34171.1 Hypothetical Protein FCC1311_103952 [Hondaea fermentalgiana]